MSRSRAIAALSAVLVTLALVAGCGTNSTDSPASSETVRITTQNGEVDVPKNPHRIVVLDATALESLDALGVDRSAIVGIPKGYLRDELAPSDVTDVAGSQPGDLNYEAIDALRPDLILSGWRFSPKQTPSLAQGLDDLGVPVAELSPTNAHTAKSLKNLNTVLGEVFDKKDRAASLNKEFDDLAVAVRTAAQKAGTGLVVMTSAGKIFLTGDGPDSRSGIYYDTYGIVPAMKLNEHISAHGDELSPETIRQANPDWLFVIDRDAALGEAGGGPAGKVLDNALVNDTTAGTKKQIVYLDPKHAYLGEGIETALTAGNTIRTALNAAQR